MTDENTPRTSNEQLIISGGIAYVESEHMGRSATVADCVRELERLRKENNTLHGVMGLWGLHPDPDDSTNAAKRAAVETPQPPSNQITAERSAEIADQLGKTSARHPAADQTKYWAWEGALHVRRQQAEIERLRAALLDAVKLIDEDVPREVKTRLCRIAGHDCEFTRLPSETPAQRCALPVITIQMLADFGQEGFFEKTSEPVRGIAGVSWSQAAVDFACLIQGLRAAKAGETTPARVPKYTGLRDEYCTLCGGSAWDHACTRPPLKASEGAA